MTDRIGTCSGCGSQFKVPAAFQGTKAKCKKCGGVVEIPAVGAAAAAPARPAAPAPPARPASPPPTRTSSTGRPASGSRAGSTARTAQAGARGAGRDAPADKSPRGGAKSDSQMVTWIAIGALVLVAALAAYFVMRGKKEPVVDPNAATAKAPPKDAAAAVAPKVEPTPAAPPVSTPTEAPAAPAEPAATAPATPEPAPEPVALIPTKLEFAVFGKLADVSDEEWTQIQDAVNGYYLSNSRKDRTQARKKLVADAQDKAIPALINALNGLDTSKTEDMIKISPLVYLIQDDATVGLLGIPFRDGAEKAEENAQFNADKLMKLVAKWKEYSDDPAKMTKFRAKVAEARAKQAAEPKDEDEGN